MSIASEFKEFALKGNVMDLAVGVIIGGAFGKIVDSLVNDVIMPVIGRITGGLDFSNYFIALSGQTATNLADAKKGGEGEATTVDVKEPVAHTFALRYLKSFTKATPLATHTAVKAATSPAPSRAAQAKAATASTMPASQARARPRRLTSRTHSGIDRAPAAK